MDIPWGIVAKKNYFILHSKTNLFEISHHTGTERIIMENCNYAAIEILLSKIVFRSPKIRYFQDVLMFKDQNLDGRNRKKTNVSNLRSSDDSLLDNFFVRFS